MDRNAIACQIRLRNVQAQIPYATGAAQRSLVAQAARLRRAMNVSAAR